MCEPANYLLACLRKDWHAVRRIFEVFHLRIELDRNVLHVKLSALVSSAFAEAADLDSLAATVTDKAIAGAVSKPVPATTGSPADSESRIPSAMAYRIEEGWDLATRQPIPTS